MEKDITGMRSGRLIALSLDPNNEKKTRYWICKCDCGNYKSVRQDHIIQQRIKSCGCYQKECGHIKGKKYGKKIAGHNRIEIKGKRFGNLVALSVVGLDKYNTEQWKCKCDCGAIHIVYKSNLLSGHTTSCGCKISKFEKEVSKILTNNNIPFKKNFTFNECRFQSGSLAKFDFYVKETYIIECDGIQHKKPSGKRFDEEKVNLIKERDKFKNKWCKENGIPVIRLPYIKMGKVSLEDLLIESSEYVI